MSYALVLLVLSFTLSANENSPVKQSSSGICHETTSPYYEKTKRFTSFDSIELCLQAGGRALGASKSNTKPAHTTSPLAFNAGSNKQSVHDLLLVDYGIFQLFMNCELRAVEFFFYNTQRDSGNEKRADQFHKDENVVDTCQQTSTETYRSRSITYDRGHMVPANHFDDTKEHIYTTNVMTNILPQHPIMNSGAWYVSEELVECWRDHDDLMVMGGPIWGNDASNDLFTNSHSVITPDAFWKVVANPKNQTLIAWVMPNTAEATKDSIDRYQVSLKQLLTTLSRGPGERVIRVLGKVNAFEDNKRWPAKSCNIG
jgi:endonuclease G